jgi:hypothetical protein
MPNFHFCEERTTILKKTVKQFKIKENKGKGNTERRSWRKKRERKTAETSGSHGCKYKDGCLPGCCAM